MPSDENWSDSELAAAVEAYLWMLEQQKSGREYRKAEVNRSLREGALESRTRSAIEWRMRNLSAVLEAHGKEWVEGYRPAENVGSGTAERIRRALEKKGFKF